MSAQQRGHRSIRTATSVLAGTGLGVAAAVGGIIAAHGSPIAEQTTQQGAGPDGAGQAGPGTLPGVQDPGGSALQEEQGSSDQGWQQQGSSDQGWQQQGSQQPGGHDRGGWGSEHVQGEGVMPGQGPAVGQSHGS